MLAKLYHFSPAETEDMTLLEIAALLSPDKESSTKTFSTEADYLQWLQKQK